MNEQQISALKGLANSKYWTVVKDEIFKPYIRDINEPHTERIQKLCETNPAAAYIGKLMASAMLDNMLATVDRFAVKEGSKQENRFD